MDHDDILIAVTRLESVATRFEALADKVDSIDTRLTRVESTTALGKSIAKWSATVAGVVVAAALILFFGIR
jgi:hypothetical protein